MNRPAGVTVLGWLAIVFGGFGFLAGLVGVVSAIGLMAYGAGSLGALGTGEGAALAGGAFFVAIVSAWLALLSLVQIVFGVGALQLKPWAWTVGLIWAWISVVSAVISLIASGGSSFLTNIISVLVAFAILYYLYRDEVRAAFGKMGNTPPSFMVPLFAQVDNMLNNRGQRPPSSPTSSGQAPPPPAPPTE